MDSGCHEFSENIWLILQNVIKWRNGQVGWVLGGFGGSVWVMGEWSVGQ